MKSSGFCLQGCPNSSDYFYSSGFCWWALLSFARTDPGISDKELIESGWFWVSCMTFFGLCILSSLKFFAFWVWSWIAAYGSSTILANLLLLTWATLLRISTILRMNHVLDFSGLVDLSFVAIFSWLILLFVENGWFCPLWKEKPVVLLSLQEAAERF